MIEQEYNLLHELIQQENRANLAAEIQVDTINNARAAAMRDPTDLTVVHSGLNTLSSPEYAELFIDVYSHEIARRRFPAFNDETFAIRREEAQQVARQTVYTLGTAQNLMGPVLGMEIMEERFLPESLRTHIPRHNTASEPAQEVAHIGIFNADIPLPPDPLGLTTHLLEAYAGHDMRELWLTLQAARAENLAYAEGALNQLVSQIAYRSIPFPVGDQRTGIADTYNQYIKRVQEPLIRTGLVRSLRRAREIFRR